MSEVKKIKINENISGQRLDNFLINELKGVPKSKIYSIIRKGEIRVNSKRKKPSYKLHKDDELRIPPVKIKERKNLFVPSKIITLLKKAVIYENNDFIAINKPEGIASHGGSGISIGVIEAIRNFGKSYRNVKLVHRLDKDTSGCQIIAKNNQFLRRCNKFISDRKVKKTYQAVVHGKWTDKKGVYEMNLKKSNLQGNERVVRVSELGKIAKSIFKPLQVKNTLSLLECELITGRTHQLRVQLLELGFPIVGDKKYSFKGNSSLNLLNFKKRMYLHANSFTAQDLDIDISIDPPEEFKKIIKIGE